MYNLSHIIIQYGHPSHDPIPSSESIRTLFLLRVCRYASIPSLLGFALVIDTLHFGPEIHHEWNIIVFNWHVLTQLFI